MLWYPQLTTGAIVHYPYETSRRERTIVNESPDGSLVRMPDPGASTVAWHVHYSGLSDSEVEAIQSLYEASEGGLRTFGFLDPNSNLLRWTEDLTERTAWSPGPHVNATATGTGVAPREFAITNGGQEPERIAQTIAAPAWFEYTVSMYIRGDVPCAIRIGGEATQAASWARFTASEAWRPVSFGVQLGASVEAITFGVEIPAGSRLCVKGVQVEPQPGRSAYKGTSSRNGVFPQTRFTRAQLRIATYGPNDHRVSLDLLSRD